MEFFKTLDSAMIGFDLNIHVAKSHDKPDGNLTVSIIPVNIVSGKVEIKPFVVTATAEELDNQYLDLFKVFDGAVTSLIDQAKQYAKDVADKAKADKEKADNLKSKPSSSSSSSSSSKPVAVKIDTKKFDILFNQAKSYEKQKNLFAAIGFYKEALKINPDSIVTKKKIDELTIEYKKPADIFSPVVKSEPVNVEEEAAVLLSTIEEEPVPAPPQEDIVDDPDQEEDPDSEDEPIDNEDPDEVSYPEHEPDPNA